MTTLKAWLQDYWYLPLVALAVAGFFWWQGRQGPEPVIEPVVSSSSTVAGASSAAPSTAASSGPTAGYVHIKGAVKKPGLYPVTGTTRWQAVVEAAGGLTPAADVTAINLAKIASDQESLYIPVKGEAPAATASGPTGATGNASDGGTLVNLNTASATELQTLSGIGPKKAADIIAYRETSGGFKTIDDLKNVSGIGDKTFERLAPLVTVGP